MKVLFVSGIDGDTRRYRCYHQQEQLAMRGVVTEFREHDDPQVLVDLLDYDIFVLHRVPHTRLIRVLIDVARLRGKPLVFETDDLVFAPELYDEIGFVDTLSPEEARQFRRDLHLQAETFQHCDCVLTTTRFLAREVCDRGKPAYVNRNAPSEEMIEISEEAYAARCQRMEEGDHPLVVGYFSGTGSHDRDFRVITDALVWMLETYPQTWLHIGGYLNLDPAFSSYHDRIRRTPYVDWRELPHLIAQVDINLAPLELDNSFCRAKSENKFVEAALVGVPTIASPVDAFRATITHGEDGLLASTNHEWKAALKMLLDSPRKRRKMGEAARCTAYTGYTPEDRSSGLVDILHRVIDRYGSPAAPSEQVLRQWAHQMKRYTEGIQGEVVRWEAQAESLRLMLRDYESQLVATVGRKNELIERQQEAIDRWREMVETKDQVIAQCRQTIKQREQTIEDIMQGRVMRLVTAIHRFWQALVG